MFYSSAQSYGSFNIFIIIAIIGFPIFLSVNAVPHGRPHQRTLRLCSKSLSDALYLVCREHGGYNEPFSYSAEDDIRLEDAGPGLVEECCYRPCSYEQLEQYCKSGNGDKTNNSQDAIEESLRIVNLPYSTSGEMISEKRVVAMNEDNEKATNKRTTEAQRGCKKTKMINAKRRKRVRGQFHVDVGKNDDEHEDINDADNACFKVRSRHVCRRRTHRKFSRRGKAHREDSVAYTPEFQVGTIFPESKDSMLHLFPSGGNTSFQRVSNDRARKSRLLDTEKKNIFLRRNYRRQ